MVVHAALDLVERIGVEGLTMKALADELGVTPMATYRHVGGKDELLALLLETLLDRVPDPVDDGRPWPERLWAFMWDGFEELARYPGMGDHLSTGTVTAAGRRIVDADLAIIRSGGYDEATARLIFSDVYAYMFGRTVLRVRAAEVQRDGAAQPRTRRGAPSLVELASDDHVRHGYSALIAGLEAMFGRDDAGSTANLCTE